MQNQQRKKIYKFYKKLNWFIVLFIRYSTTQQPFYLLERILDAMISILEEYRKKGLNYSASSLTERSLEENKYNVFVDDKTYFCSSNAYIDSWWQITFQNPVKIQGYLMKEVNCHWGRPINWIINISSDNINWKTINTMTNVDTCANKDPFELPKAYTCKFFRIILKKNACDYTCASTLTISYVDVYGVSTTKLHCSCKQKILRSVNIASIFIFFSS